MKKIYVHNHQWKIIKFKGGKINEIIRISKKIKKSAIAHN